MATTPLDSLVVTLNLDPSGLVKGTRTATDELKKSKESIVRGAGDVEDASKSAGFGISALRLGVAGLGVAMGYVAAKDVKEWVKQMTAAGSATERFANRNNTTVGNVTALRGAVRQAGGTFGEADASLAGLVNQIARLNLYGDVSKFPQLRALGVNIADFDLNKSDDILRFIEALTKASQNRPKSETAALLSDIGLAPGAIDLVLGGDAAFKRRLDFAKQFSKANEDAAKWARQVDEAFAKNEQYAESIKAKIYSWIGPTLVVNLERIGKILGWISEKVGASEPASPGAGTVTSPAASTANSPSAGSISPSGGGLARITTSGGRTVTVSADAAPAFKGFLDTLERQGAPLGDLGGYNNRNIAGTNIPSEHSKGLAIDMGSMSGRDQIDPALRSWISSHPSQWRAALSQYGMRSGGDFKNPDLGHVEYTTNVNVTTQPGADAKTIAAETAAQTKRALLAAGANGGSQ